MEETNSYFKCGPKSRLQGSKDIKKAKILHRRCKQVKIIKLEGCGSQTTLGTSLQERGPDGNLGSLIEHCLSNWTREGWDLVLNRGTCTITGTERQ